MNFKIYFVFLLFLSFAACSKDDLPTADLSVLPAGDLPRTLESFPNRQGSPPQTMRPVPHQQLEQFAPIPLQVELKKNINQLPGVTVRPTGSSLAGSEGWFLDESLAKKEGPIAFNRSGEFGHSHTPSEGSMHLFLPPSYAQIVVEKRWGELHEYTDSIAGEDSRYLMVYGPRDRVDLDSVWKIVQASYAYATGKLE